MLFIWWEFFIYYILFHCFVQGYIFKYDIHILIRLFHLNMKYLYKIAIGQNNCSIAIGSFDCLISIVSFKDKIVDS